MTVRSWFDFHIDEKLDTYFYLYDGYITDKDHMDDDLLMKKIGQENGVIVGFMKTQIFEDMAIWIHGLLSHIMMMTSYFMMIGLVLTYVDYHG